MHRKRVLIISVLLGVLFSVTALVILTIHNRANKVTVSFVDSEVSYGPSIASVKCERLAFDVRNAGSKLATFNVYEIQDAYGNWAPSVHSLKMDETDSGVRLYLYLPLGSHPKSLRMHMLRKASVVQKTHIALTLLINKAFGRYPGKQFWYNDLQVPARDFTVKLDTAPGSRPRTAKN